MNVTKTRLHSLAGLLLALLALLGLGALQQRRAFLTRGIPDGLPGPIPHSGVKPGINVSLGQYDDAALTANLDQIRSAGFTAVKQSFYYHPDFDWQASDRLVTAVVAADLTLVPLLDGNPADDFDPVNPDAFAAWTGQFATRYGDAVNHYIVWDEPNLQSHWGGQPVNPLEYAALLTAASQSIRTADADAVIVAAPLAPTTETGPLNLADHLFLQLLYEAGAANAFDVAAGKPYGFDSGPQDRTVDPKTLNFSRIILLREVMLRNGDGQKAIWAGNWGWNSLPSDWDGLPSVWGQTTAAEQVAYTTAALERARREWPWMGIMFLENWDPDLPADDPRWGFSVKEKLETGEWRLGTDTASISTLRSPLSHPGFHPARPDDPAQEYTGEWRFSPQFGADIGASGDTVTFTFWGTDAGLRVRRADFRARLHVTVDGTPANALPRDENGAVLVLTSPGEGEDYVAIEPVARDLSPGEHTMTVVASRGWDQWALNGFSVGYRPPASGYRWGLIGLGLTAVLGLILAFTAGRRANWGYLGRKLAQRYHLLQQWRQLLLTAATAIIVALTGWLTWGAQAAGVYRRLGDGSQLALTAAAASVFYIAPSFLVYLPALGLLFLLIYFRPVWGVALVALCIPFSVSYQLTAIDFALLKPILGYRFSPVEVFTLVTVAAWLASQLTQWRAQSNSRFGNLKLHGADYAVLAFVAVATLSLPFTTRPGVATNEWRMVIVEPALFYLLLRGVRLTRKEMWVVLDAFVLGGLIVASYGLWQYAFDRENLITAEGGLLRLRSIYGSPNNVALFLGRVLPLLAAMTLLGRENGRRRWLYGLAAVPIGLAIVLSFSKGALFLGLPTALAYIFWRWQRGHGRRTWPWLLGFGVAGAAALLLALQIPALAGRLNVAGATGVFRINLWHASLNMVADHPLFGVGLDNFLYAYRGRYIFDAAWQEPNLNHPHNIILDFATRLGLVGLLAGGWLIGRAVRILWRLEELVTAVWRPVAVGMGAALLDMLAHGLVDHSLFLVDLAFTFYLLLGTAVWLQKNAAKKRN